MAPSTYRAQLADGRIFRVVAGSDSGAAARARALGAVASLRRECRAGRTIEVNHTTARANAR